MEQEKHGRMRADRAGQRELETYLPAHAASLEKLKAFCPEYFAIIEEFGLGKLWQRTTLTKRDMEIVVLSSLITQGDSEIQIRQHVHTALKRGMTREEILECILLLTVYIGVPRTLNAIQIVRSEMEAVA